MKRLIAAGLKRCLTPGEPRRGWLLKRLMESCLFPFTDRKHIRDKFVAKPQTTPESQALSLAVFPESRQSTSVPPSNL